MLEVTLSSSQTFLLIRELHRIRSSGIVSWLVGGSIFLAAIVVSLDLDTRPSGLAFITFPPAIAVITLVSGWRVAGAMALCSSAAAWWLLLRPPGGPDLPQFPELLALAVFLGGCAVIVGLVDWLAHIAVRATLGDAAPLAEDPRVDADPRFRTIDGAAAAAFPSPR